MIEIKKESIKFFKKNGFFLYKNFFKKTEINKAKKWMLSQNPKKIIKSWTETEPAVKMSVYSVLNEKKTPVSILSNNKKMLEVASSLIEDDVYVWHSKINFKKAWAGTVEYFHQDRVYWQDRGYPSDKMLSCMIMMDDHNLHNSGLQIFPRTHKLGFIKHQNFININSLAKFMIPPKSLDKLQKKYKKLQVEGKAGDVLFFHSSLVHGSGHNTSDRDRMIILTQLNTKNNLPKDVNKNAIKFNLYRSKLELNEAKRRLAWFKKKYDTQKNQNKITYFAPIPKNEIK